MEVGRTVAFGALVGIGVLVGSGVGMGVSVLIAVGAGVAVARGVRVNTSVAVGAGVRIIKVLVSIGVEVGFAANQPIGSDQSPLPNRFSPRILNKRPVGLSLCEVNKSTPTADHCVDNQSYQCMPLLSDLCMT